MNKIAIIQQIVPNYRVGFFNALADKVDFILYTGKRGIEKNIRTSFKKANYKISLVDNINVLNRLTFQKLPFKEIFLTQVVIFEFNIRIVSTLLLLWVRILFRKKNILWTHGVTENMSSFSRILRLFFLKKASSVIVYEDSAKEVLAGFGVLERNIIVAKNSVDFSEIERYSNFNCERSRITYIGRIVKEKNIRLLCEAFLSATDKIPYFVKLTIIGDGEELNNLKKIFNSNMIEFVGFLDDESQISTYMNQTIFTVSPDYLGLMIIHSFSYAVPILVNKNPDLQHSPEIGLFKENINGWYFDKTQECLENKIIHLLTKHENLKSFGLNGFNHVKKYYGFEIMSDNFLKALKVSLV